MIFGHVHCHSLWEDSMATFENLVTLSEAKILSFELRHGFKSTFAFFLFCEFIELPVHFHIGREE